MYRHVHAQSVKGGGKTYHCGEEKVYHSRQVVHFSAATMVHYSAALDIEGIGHARFAAPVLDQNFVLAACPHSAHPRR